MITNNATVTPFPHNPHTSDSSRIEYESDSVVLTRAHTRTRTRDEAEILPESNGEFTQNRLPRRVLMTDIGQYYADTFGAPLPPVASREIQSALDAGLDAELVLIAIDEAAMAPRPSWAYARAIIRRLLAEDCLTEAAYQARQSRWHARKRGNSDLPF